MKMQNESLPRNSKRAAGVCASIAFILVLTPPAMANTFTVKGERDAACARLEFEFKEGIVSNDSRPGNRELLLQFDRSIDPPSMDGVLADFKDWIAWISNGYDTLLIHASRDVKFNVSAPSSGRIVIELAPMEHQKQADETEQPLQLQLVQSRILSSTGHSNQAAALLRQVLQSHGWDGQVLSALADLELAANRWRRAADLYAKAISTEPRNEDLIEAREQIFSNHAPTISFENNFRSFERERSELLSSISTGLSLSMPTRVSMRIDQNLVSLFKDGTAQLFQRMETSLQHDFLNGSVFRGAFYSNGRRFGAGTMFNAGDSRGTTRIEADYGKPFWDLLTGIQQYGVRDRLEFSRSQKLFPRVSAQLNAALNRYRMQDAVAAKTYSVNGNLDYTLRQRYPVLEIQYIADVEKRTDNLGSTRLPLSNRDVHGVGFAVTTPIGSRAQLFGSAGFAADLDGGHGPFTSVRLTRRLKERFSLEVWAERRRNSVSTGQTVTTVGAKLEFHFIRGSPGRRKHV